MSALATTLHVIVLAALPILLVGLINRTKAVWAGRKGPPLLQLFFELRRLLSKQPVYSEVTTPVFRLGPLVLLGTTLVSGLFVPLLAARAPLSFPLDFVAVAYLWGLGRVALILPALDTGSAFEGMGASREATLSALLEPVLIATLGSLALATGQRSFAGLLALDASTPVGLAISLACVTALFVVVQVESARVPVDDPNTHLELTMVHEVMILDHSGPELALVQYAAALKLTIGAALIASLVNPFFASGRVAALFLQIGLLLVVAVAVGCIESLVARFKLRAVPQYILIGLVAAFIALLSAAWRNGLA